MCFFLNLMAMWAGGGVTLSEMILDKINENAMNKGIVFD